MYTYVMNQIRFFLPLAFLSTILCALIYGAVQQNYRQSGYDPQIQLSEDIATRLGRGQAIQSVIPSTNKVDPSTSLAPFVIVIDDNFNVASSTGEIANGTLSIPKGVLEYTKTHGQDRLTWEPQSNVRIATIVTRFAGTNSGYVLVGRSLREVEKRTLNLLQMTITAWILSLVGIFILSAVLSSKKK